MTTSTARRQFLKTVVGGAAGLSVSSMLNRAVFARARESSIEVIPLTDDLLLFSSAGGNAVVLKGVDGAVMVDGALPEHSAALLSAISEHTPARSIHTLFNTHWHWESSGANERLGKAGAKIVAHENTKLWLGGDFYVPWQDKAYEPRPAHALPTETFYTSGKMSAADREIVYAHLPRAHTDGDLYVFFPAANVLVAGGLMSVGSYPILDYTTGGWIGGMADACQALLELTDAQTRIVPSFGPVQIRADLQAQHEMLTTLKDRLVGMMKKGMGAEDMLAAQATKEFDAKWGDPTLFVSNAYHGLWGHVRYLGGIV